ncbi:hypothetical protein A6U86_34090 [Rhizobium sp. AC27/96]|nr:hypothetical protein A6U86_34090 [Rhizobium sp. AC27/96]
MIKRPVHLEFGAHDTENAVRNFEGAAADRVTAIPVGTPEFIEFGAGFLINAAHVRFVVRDHRVDAIGKRRLAQGKKQQAKGAVRPHARKVSIDRILIDAHPLHRKAENFGYFIVRFTKSRPVKALLLAPA